MSSRICIILSLWLFYFCSGFSSSANAQIAQDLARCGSGTVSEIISGDKIALASGQRVVLAGIRAPSYLLKDGKFDFKRSWPYAAESRATLRRLALDKDIILHCEGRRNDRHGRLIAQVITKDGLWINQEMLRRGLAFSYPYNGQKIAPKLLYEAEDYARSKRHGLWQGNSYPIFDSLQAKEVPTNRFVIVRGHIENAAKAGLNVYLNFGNNWREDFTIKIAKKDMAKLEEMMGSSLEGMKGRLIEVRDWSHFAGGPQIDLKHLGRLRVIAGQ